MQYKFKNSFLHFISLLPRIVYYYFIEKKIEASYDTIFLQTPVDVKIFNKIYKSKKTVAIPNIPHIDANDFDITGKRDRQKIGFVASFDGSYLPIANWFINKVWKEIIKYNPNLRLHLVGKCSKNFHESIDTQIKYSIIAEDYKNDLSNFYNEVNIVVAPIFKGYGIINKVIEGMGNGTVVIGDPAAFNGIQAIHRNNCIIAENAEDFIKYILEYSSFENSSLRIAARETIMRNFDSSIYVSKLLSLLKDANIIKSNSN